MSKTVTIRKEGGSKVLAVTKIFPLDWQLVEVTKVKINNDCVTVVFERVK